MPLKKVTSTTLYEGLEVSYGVAPILNTFTTLSAKTIRPKWNLFLINVETLIRNRDRDIQLSNKELAESVLNDMQVLAQYISSFNRNNTSYNHKRNYAIFFYLPHYDGIPEQYLRKSFPKGTEHRWEVRDEMEEMLQKQTVQNAIDNTRIYYVTVGSKKNHTWPHKDLLKDIMTNEENSQYSSVLMISHVPVDFHLYKYFKEFTILESYTGAMKQKKDLGKKVFHDNNIPFNKYTHLLLGDKWYLNALAPAKMKSQMKKEAISHHWNIIPDRGVLSSVMSFNTIDHRLFIDPDI